MAKPKKLSVAQVEEAIKRHRGNVSAIARSFGVSRNTVQARVDESPLLQRALYDARETMLDEAEATIYDKVIMGDVACLLFFLRTQGKKRGWVERQEVTGADSEPLSITVKYVDAGA